MGYRTVTVGMDKGAVDAICREGITAHVAMGSFSLPKADLRERDLLARRLDGKPAKWFGSGCPNNPKIRQASLRLARCAASMEGVDAVILDGIRFASPGEGIEVFLSCFCSTCRRKAEELGYDMPTMESSLRDLLKSLKRLTPPLLRSVVGWNSPIDLLDPLLRYPGILEWFRFRADCICEHVADVRRAIRSANPRCEIGAYLFPPSLSHLVGQDYRRLAKLLDYVEPMIYRTGQGVACLNYEAARMAADMRERGRGLGQVEIQRFLFGLLGLGAEPETSISRLKEGISHTTVESEARRAMRTVEASKLVPILFLDDPMLEESVTGALKSGIKRISFFHFYEGAEKAMRIVDKAIRAHDALFR